MVYQHRLRGSSVPDAESEETHGCPTAGPGQALPCLATSRYLVPTSFFDPGCPAFWIGRRRNHRSCSLTRCVAGPDGRQNRSELSAAPPSGWRTRRASRGLARPPLPGSRHVSVRGRPTAARNGATPPGREAQFSDCPSMSNTQLLTWDATKLRQGLAHKVSYSCGPPYQVQFPPPPQTHQPSSLAGSFERVASGYGRPV